MDGHFRFKHFPQKKNTSQLLNTNIYIPASWLENSIKQHLCTAAVEKEPDSILVCMTDAAQTPVLVSHLWCNTLTYWHISPIKRNFKKLNELKLLHHGNAEDWNTHI